MKERIQEKYREIFGSDPKWIVRSPGRINIIGEHTDYNNGFVLPAAIDKAIYMAIGPSYNDFIHLYAGDYKASYDVALSDVKKSDKEWANYILGVVNELQQSGKVIKGFNALVSGDLPIGAGMSSSAAVECATVFGLNEMNGLGISRLEMARIAQKAEHHFAGVLCGIMDMFASLMGKKDHAIKLDCRSMEYEYVPLHLGDYQIVLFNTNVKHSLASSEYNTRRMQCEAGVAMIQSHHPEVYSLRDVTENMLDQYVADVNPEIDQRCRFIVQEIGRLQEVCAAMQKDDIKTLGRKMFETHEGLSRQYGVSCKELDYLVDAVRNETAVAGARMMGGGFGGCTINLIHKNELKNLIHKIGEAYQRDMKLPFTAYEIKVENGTELL